ncbi:MAG: DUF2442 domain-containing protein [Bacteroidetes bacterium]|nr:DUF2442 domain-containing protein [Bacteroidota bacterium]
MNPRVEKVVPMEGGILKIKFTNNEYRIFDVKPYFDKGIFAELKKQDVFKTAHVFNGTVVWDNELDFCPDTLYLESKEV